MSARDDSIRTHSHMVSRSPKGSKMFTPPREYRYAYMDEE